MALHSISGSESESSDTENSSDKSLYSRCRLESVRCLHTLAAKDAQKLHTSWLNVLPVYKLQATRLQDVTLVDMLLNDPVPKVNFLFCTISYRFPDPAIKALQRWKGEDLFRILDLLSFVTFSLCSRQDRRKQCHCLFYDLLCWHHKVSLLSCSSDFWQKAEFLGLWPWYQWKFRCTFIAKPSHGKNLETQRDKSKVEIEFWSRWGWMHPPQLQGCLREPLREHIWELQSSLNLQLSLWGWLPSQQKLFWYPMKHLAKNSDIIWAWSRINDQICSLEHLLLYSSED